MTILLLHQCRILFQASALIMEFAPMPNSDDSNHSGIVVDFVANPPIAHTNPPPPFFGLHFQASVGRGLSDKATAAGKIRFFVDRSSRLNSRSAWEVIITSYIDLARVSHLFDNFI
jgi:hypothetical protein